ncbi:uncharacterized protein LDX57_004114 [Aspergillus melleus]|uniref:uncharacterized protein n=1 Tax=Aspergillus melleus TaxID=138277 RepID=UPI001E8EEF3B|nr:uncharacterized protein LDX57_004114 [Aspergillus melleus]KAH8426376.1 hypothetical protein LDX57_004114 [Aspergillus melleus]
MAEAFGIASGLVGLAGFAFQTSKSLYQLVESFKSSKRAIRDLRDELQSLNDVLKTLKGTAAELEDELDALKQPLLRCGRICQEFEEILKSCTSHSGVDRTSFRDWAKLRYMGGDINNLRTTLAGYKATISIALGSATFRHAAVTSNVLDEFKRMIDEATSDLQDHLHEIYENLQLLNEASEGPLSSDLDSRVIEEEKQSTEQCLDICAQASEYIESLQAGMLHDSVSTRDLPAESAHKENVEPQHAKKVTAAMFHDFQLKLNANSNSLESRLAELRSRLAEAQKRQKISKDEATRLETMQEEKDSVEQCLNICADASDLAGSARINSFEDVNSADDSRQLIVSTIGDLISAKRIVTGNRSEQWLGQMSDDTIRHLSQTPRTVVGNLGESKEGTSQEKNTEFHNRWGAGYPLKTKSEEGHASFSR